jgi:hypothetical protein
VQELLHIILEHARKDGPQPALALASLYRLFLKACGNDKDCAADAFLTFLESGQVPHEVSDLLRRELPQRGHVFSWEKDGEGEAAENEAQSRELTIP